MSALDELLATDSLGQAESITGKSYKDDDSTMALGFLMHIDNAARKEAALKEARDSWFSMNLADTLALYRDMGFEEVLCDTFTGRSYSDEAAPTETYRILWHPKGILATVESHQRTSRNAAKIYYNVDVTDSESWSGCISSGAVARSVADRKVWVGDHGAREGVRRAIARWEEAGCAFLPAWVERPFLWLLTYTESDVEGYDYAAINAERIGRLPAHVRDAIGGGS